jgi:competence ComEA-like helix-hairpin-helix protein
MLPKLSKDESRAVAFIGLLLGLSAAARLLDRPVPVPIDAPVVDLAVLEAESRRERERGTQPELRPGERIDPNTASADQLMRLPGAGRAVAERIVTERGVAVFRTVEDLDRVRGVGPVSLDRWAPFLTLPRQAAGPAPTTAAAVGRTAPAAARTREQIDLNRASAAELERLPGVGPALAGRIIAYRDSVGRFGNVGELERVRGIGPALVAKLTPLVRTGM